MAKKVLITGGLGFIFSHVTQYFVQKGWEVVVIDKQSSGCHPEIIDGTFKNYKLDVCRPEVFDVIAKENPDYLIHAAAISDVDDSTRKPLRVHEKNIVGNANLFEAARLLPNLQKFLYVSTDEVYGECEHRMKETDMLHPKNPYSSSKAAGSLMHIAYENTFPNLRGKIVESRFCNVFGPRQDDRKVIPAIKRAVEGGTALGVHNEGKGYREYIYVKNIPSAVEIMLENGEGVYNLTLNDGFTVVDLVDRIEKVTGKEVPTTPSHRPGMDMRYQMDGTRIQNELGWQAEYTFDQGLEEYFGTKQ
ncbi:MAG: GDP-mannose 4,6-dehydratase [Candidatus Pacebacteria bacterium]|nr:GDP-mannose 4,6-dehydratase [Candidatus Paceibacterota bacterium]